MPRAKRTCSDHTDGINCPHVATNGTRCKAHADAYEAARGPRQARGYGREHDALRRKAARVVMAGKAVCWRCGEPIVPGRPWDLGHADDGTYAGPEHAGGCNRRAAGLKAHGLPWTAKRPPVA